MKKFTWYKKLATFYRTHTFLKLLGTVAVVAALLLLIWYIPVAGVKKSKLPTIQQTDAELSGEEISKDAGEVLVAETDEKALYIDTKTMNLRVVDKKTKKEWNSLYLKSSQSTEQSLLTLIALGEDNNLYEYNSFEYCTLLGTYQINRITNGVRIVMQFGEGESTSFYEYFPSKMPIERFEGFFLDGADRLVEEGTLTKEIAEKYKQTIQLIYRKNQAENSYAVANNATPPTSATKQLIEFAKLLGYTTEMLVEDSEAFGLSVTFREPASFELELEAVLDGKDFLVRIPTDRMSTGNSFYTIQNIRVLPNFGATASTDIEDGYILVPDGAGALFKFNSYSSTVPDYIRPVYDNDYYSDYYFMPEYGEELRMPIYGMTYGMDESATHGFLAIIEDGAETSYINVKLAGVGNESGSLYNKVYASFDTVQYSRVKVYGPYSEESATYLTKTDPISMNYTIRYQLFPEQVDYFDMAVSYRNYLTDLWGKQELIYPDKQGLYFDFIGTLSLTKRFLGIPYDSEYSMTTYQELSEILQTEAEKNLILEYSGFFNGGLANELYRHTDLTSANGKKKDLKALRELAEQQNTPLYFEASISTVYEEGNGFYASSHAVHNYSDSPAQIYRYFSPLGIMDGYAYDYTKYYYLLSPYYLPGIANNFLKDSKDYEKISIPDLAQYVYSDYKYNRGVTPAQAFDVVDQTLDKMAQQKELSLTNPNMESVKYAKVATDISRESSDYKTFDTTIPFRQLVLNGLTIETTENVNMSTKSPDYYVLQAVELAMYPKFTLTAKNVDVLKNGAYSYLYSTEYSKLKQTIDQVYQKVAEAFTQIGSSKIVDHYRLADQVFCTEYESGVSVITNYNLKDVTVNGQTLEALSYRLEK